MNVERVLELFVDTESAAGLAVTTLAIVLVAAGLRVIAVLLTRHRFDDDPYRRYWSAKIVTYIIAAIAVVALVALWAPLGGRLSVILGFATAGIAFAMQEVIGALFGWVNILAGRIYTVGDRVEVAGVRGDVIEITPLRTKLFEIGSESAPNGASASWVSARQPTGRVVTVSNKKTFTEPVFNFSAHLEWIWEEVIFAVGRDADWAAGEAIVLEEMKADEPELRREGEAALARLSERYLLSRSEVEPQTYLLVAAGDIEIVGRFVAPGGQGPHRAPRPHPVRRAGHRARLPVLQRRLEQRRIDARRGPAPTHHNIVTRQATAERRSRLEGIGDQPDAHEAGDAAPRRVASEISDGRHREAGAGEGKNGNRVHNCIRPMFPLASPEDLADNHEAPKRPDAPGRSVGVCDRSWTAPRSPHPHHARLSAKPVTRSLVTRMQQTAPQALVVAD